MFTYVLLWHLILFCQWCVQRWVNNPKKKQCVTNKTIHRGVRRAKVSLQTGAGDKHRLNSNYVERKSIRNIDILSQLLYKPITDNGANEYYLFSLFLFKYVKGWTEIDTVDNILSQLSFTPIRILTRTNTVYFHKILFKSI